MAGNFRLKSAVCFGEMALMVATELIRLELASVVDVHETQLQLRRCQFPVQMMTSYPVVCKSLEVAVGGKSVDCALVESVAGRVECGAGISACDTWNVP